MSDTDPTPYRNLASTLWAAVTRDVQAAVNRLTDLRRVQAVEDDGRVTVASTNPEKPAPQVMARLRGAIVTPGDDVVTMWAAGHEYIVGTVALPGDAVAGTDDPTAVLDGVLTDLGYQTTITTQEVLIVVPVTVKYNGVTWTMSARELAYCRKTVEDFPGGIDLVSTGKLRARARVVWRTELLDIDAWLADPANYYNGAPDSLAYSPNNLGRYVHAPIVGRLLTNQYGGQQYDQLVAFFSKAVVNSGPYYGLTPGQYSFINIDDTTLGSPDGNWNEGMIHEYGHTMEDKAAQAGHPLAYGPDSAGGEQLNGTSKYKLDPQRGYYDFFQDMYTNKLWYPGLTTKGPIADPDPRTVLVPRRPIDPDNNWDAVLQRRIAFQSASGTEIQTYPDHVKAGANVTFTADGEGVIVSSTGGTSGGTPGPTGATGATGPAGPAGTNAPVLTVRNDSAVVKTGPSNLNVYRGIQAVAYGDGTAGVDLSINYADPIFVESVQDLVAALLTAGTGIVRTYDDAANTFTIAVSPDVTQTTNFRAVGMQGFDAANIRRWWLTPPLGLYLYAASGALQGVFGSGGLSLYNDTGSNTVSITGTGVPRFATTPTVGPSGSAVPVSIEGHTHTAANVTDFAEAAQDAVAAMLAAGTGVTLAYDDAANTLTITGTAGGGGGTTDPEIVRDTIGVALIGAGLVTVTVNDAADTITLSTTATANSTDAQLRDRGAHTGAQAIATVTGLQAGLDAKQDVSTVAELIRDTMGVALVAGTNVTIAVNDVADTITLGAIDVPDGPTLPDAGAWISVHNTFAVANKVPAAVAMVANRMYGTPFRVRRRGNVAQVSFRVTVAGGNMRFGIYRLADNGLSMTLTLESGVIAANTIGFKNTTYAWGIQDPGTYVAVLLADAAVTVTGIAAGALDESPWPIANAFNPSTGYTAGTAVAVPNGINRAQVFGSMPATVTLVPADILDALAPVMWVMWDPT
jgi:hypothetical protein